LRNLPSREVILPEMDGAQPARPEKLFQLQRLCMHIYGLTCRDVEGQARALAAAAGDLRKKHRLELAATLVEELPVLVALHVMRRLEADSRLKPGGLAELLRGLMLPLFALSYRSLYDNPADPLEHVLNRLDWYLDGDKGQPIDAFQHFLATAWGERINDSQGLINHLEYKLLPELDRRLELAFRYEFG